MPRYRLLWVEGLVWGHLGYHRRAKLALAIGLEGIDVGGVGGTGSKNLIWQPESLPAQRPQQSEVSLVSWGAHQVQYDLFISHASEDKAALVGPLVEALTDCGLRVWYDTQEIHLGDDFRRKMDHGLSVSRFGVVVLSPSFRNYWPEAELSAFFNQERVFDEKRILPLVHELTHQEVTKAWPLLAARAAAYSSEGLETLVEKICQATRAVVEEKSVPIPGPNAFVPWKPVVPLVFEGRGKELYRLGSALESRDGISIVCDSKIGKSSLLLTWQQKLRESGRRVCYVDGQGAAGASEAASATPG